MATGRGPHDLAVAPDGKSLYVVNVSGATIAQDAISLRTGALSARPVSTSGTVPTPEAIALKLAISKDHEVTASPHADTHSGESSHISTGYAHTPLPWT